jgi:hypothetical protein
VDCECEDLNRSAPAEPPANAPAGLTVDIARRPRRLYDIEAAALAAAGVLLGRPEPDVLAAARVWVAADAHTVTTAQSNHHPGSGVRPSAGARLGRPVPAAGGVGVRRRRHLSDAASGKRSSAIAVWG